MASETTPEEHSEAPPIRRPHRTIGERVRSLTHRLIGRLAPRDDETERKPLRTRQKIGAAVISVGALGFWWVFLYFIVT